MRKRVNIKGAGYKVTRRPAKSETEEPDVDLDGYCDLESKTIAIYPHIKEDRYFLVMIHEMIHACLYEVGVDVSNELEEVIAESVSSMIHQNFEVKWKTKQKKR